MINIIITITHDTNHTGRRAGGQAGGQETAMETHDDSCKLPEIQEHSLLWGLDTIDRYIYIYIERERDIIYTIYQYGRFPRPASTKNTKLYIFCVRIETHIPYQSTNTQGLHETSIPHTTPRKHTMLSWPASGYAQGLRFGVSGRVNVNAPYPQSV